MANKTAAKAGMNTVMNLMLRLLVGLLFVCIGIQGVAGTYENALYEAINEDWINIILGVVLIVAGLLVIVPSFIKGIKPSFTKVSMILISVVWCLVIVFSDFVYGFGRIGDAMDIFFWLENFIYHLLILFAIIKASKTPVVKVTA